MVPWPVSTCCCCIKLRTGGLIIAWLQVILSLYFLPYDVLAGNELFSFRTVLDVLLFIFSVFLLIGIYKNNPGYMVPSLITLISIAASLVVFPVVTLAFYFNDIRNYIEEVMDAKPQVGIVILVVIIVVNYILAAILLYTSAVLYSLHKHIHKVTYQRILP